MRAARPPGRLRLPLVAGVRSFLSFLLSNLELYLNMFQNKAEPAIRRKTSDIVSGTQPHLFYLKPQTPNAKLETSNLNLEPQTVYLKPQTPDLDRQSTNFKPQNRTPPASIPTLANRWVKRLEQDSAILYVRPPKPTSSFSSSLPLLSKGGTA